MLASGGSVLVLRSEFNVTRATEAIRAATGELKDMTPLYRDVVEYMIEATRQRFAKGIDPQGNAWAPKKQSTLDRYKRLGYGNLRRVLVGPSRQLSRQIVGEATRSGAVIGSALIYSRVMQEGADKGEFGNDRRGRPVPWGKIPARVWLGMSHADEQAVVEIVDEHLGGHLGTPG
jgi:phage virion morphogenesis protein